MLTYMTRSVKMEVFPHKGARDSVVERSFVSLDKAHCGGSFAKKQNAVVNVKEVIWHNESRYLGGKSIS
jgi:hypothetical protein